MDYCYQSVRLFKEPPGLPLKMLSHIRNHLPTFLGLILDAFKGALGKMEIPQKQIVSVQFNKGLDHSMSKC